MHLVLRRILNFIFLYIYLSYKLVVHDLITSFISFKLNFLKSFLFVKKENNKKSSSLLLGNSWRPPWCLLYPAREREMAYREERAKCTVNWGEYHKITLCINIFYKLYLNISGEHFLLYFETGEYEVLSLNTVYHDNLFHTILPILPYWANNFVITHEILGSEDRK